MHWRKDRAESSGSVVDQTLKSSLRSPSSFAVRDTAILSWMNRAATSRQYPGDDECIRISIHNSRLHRGVECWGSSFQTSGQLWIKCSTTRRMVPPPHLSEFALLFGGLREGNCSDALLLLAHKEDVIKGPSAIAFRTCRLVAIPNPPRFSVADTQI
jgi:hypothetical protein